MKELFKAQDIHIIIPYPGKEYNGDIAVFSSTDSPEYRYYVEDLAKRKIPYIIEKDWLRALALSLVYPRKQFSKVTIGVDPGNQCGIVVLGDGVLIYGLKIDCSKLGESIRKIYDSIPSRTRKIYVGNGTGLETVITELNNIGFEYIIIDENTTTRTPIKSNITKLLKDKDLIAGYTIAVRGDYDWGIRVS